MGNESSLEKWVRALTKPLMPVVLAPIVFLSSYSLPRTAQAQDSPANQPVPAQHEKDTEGLARTGFDETKDVKTSALERWLEKISEIDKAVVENPDKDAKQFIKQYRSLRLKAKNLKLPAEIIRIPDQKIYELDPTDKYARKNLKLVDFVTFEDAKESKKFKDKKNFLERIFFEEYGIENFCDGIFYISSGKSRKEKQERKWALDSIMRKLRKRTEFVGLPEKDVKKAAEGALEEMAKQSLYIFDIGRPLITDRVDGAGILPTPNKEYSIIVGEPAFNGSERDFDKDACYISAVLKACKPGLEIKGKKINLGNVIMSYDLFLETYGYFKVLEKFGIEKKEVRNFLCKYSRCQRVKKWYEGLPQYFPEHKEAFEQMRDLLNDIYARMHKLGHNIIKTNLKDEYENDVYELQKLPDVEANKVSKK